MFKGKKQERMTSTNKVSAHPLLGPRFIGTLLKEHFEPTRLQLEHCSIPDSDDASQRI
jgi:hypothetical protein